MKRLKNLLPAIALLVGATMAMAMNFADNPTIRFAEDPDTHVWYDLTGITPGASTYECDYAPTETCSREEASNSSPQVEVGEFVKNGSLPLAMP